MLWPYVRPDVGLLGLGFGALAVASFSNAMAPRLLRAVIDGTALGGGAAAGAGGEGDAGARERRTLLRAFAIFTAGAIGSCVRTLCFGVVSARVGRRLRDALFGNVVTQELLFFTADKTKAAAVVDALAQDVGECTTAITSTAGNLLRYTSSVVTGSAMVIGISGRAALSFAAMSLSVMPVVAAAALIQYKRLSRARAAADRLRIETSSFVTERLAAISTVRAFARESHEAARFQTLTREAERAGVIVAKAEGLFYGTLDLTIKGAAVTLVSYGASLVRRGDLSAGSLTSFTMYSGLVGMGVAGLWRTLAADWQTPAARVLHLSSRHPALPLTGGAAGPDRLTGRVAFEDVSFAYPNRPDQGVVEGLSFQVQPGQVVALAGPSGCGKSTVGRLLLQFYKPSRGRILFDGRPAADFDPSWLRRQIGVVEQDATLFSGSVRDNIRYGNLDANDEAVEAAARLANAHDFITTLPDGYETDVGERGQRLSGGQRQRIAIARALVKDPPILLLDEATAALDTEAEAAVHEALRRAMNDRTVLVFAHNEANFNFADRIGMLGAVDAAQGRPAKLLQFGAKSEVFVSME